MPALLDLHHPEALPAGPVEVVGGVASGQLRVKDPLDFESDRSHEVTVSVSDSKDAAGSADTAVDASIAVTVVAEFTAEDPEGGSLTWEPLGGADLDDFTFADGTLEFVDPPDRETPTDHDGDNTYEVVVGAGAKPQTPRSQHRANRAVKPLFANSETTFAKFRPPGNYEGS